MELYKSIASQLLDIGKVKSSESSQKLTDGLTETLSLKACTLYSFNKRTQKLTLRSASSFDLKDYKSLQLSLNSCAGESITTKKLKLHSNLANNDLFRDKKLVVKYQLNTLITIPLLEAEDSETVKCVLCLYASGDTPKTEDNELLHIGRLYFLAYKSSLEVDKAILREEIVSHSINSKDLNSFLHKTLDIFKNWGFEASSVFLQDKRNDFLYMRATTGVDSDIDLVARVYRPQDESSLTRRSFNTGSILTIADPDKKNPSGKYPEIVSGNKVSELFLPIFEPVDREEEVSKIGVLRTVNKIINYGSVAETCCHSWEDERLAVFACEIIGIIGHIYHRVDETSLNFERALHGVTRPIRVATNYLAKSKKILGRLEYNSKEIELRSNLDQFINNSIAEAKSLSWQVRKHASRQSNSRLTLKRVEIFGAVLSKAVNLTLETHRSYGLKSISINKLLVADFLKTPSIEGDSEALLGVFRNLLENAMKYRQRGSLHCDIDIRWRATRSHVFIEVKDYGFGIRDDDALSLFREGSRSDEAMRADPPGTGIGLYDSRDNVRKMGGDLYITRLANPTTFTVKLVRWMPG